MKKTHSTGDVIVIEIHQPKEGKFPIGRTESGMICLIPKGIKGYFEYNSTWSVEVLEVKAKVLIVKPVECLMSAAANAYEMQKKLASFKPINGKILL